MNRRAVTGALALLVVAALVPLGWFLTRPAADQGRGVGSFAAPVLPGAGSTPTPRPGAGASPTGEVTVRPAVGDPGTSQSVDQPTHLRIDAIGVDAPVDAVGVRTDGAMFIPEDVRRVGWYRYGSAPSDTAGAAVIAGHVDSKQQGAGALIRLRELSIGDEIHLTLASGTTLRYRVVGKQTLVKKRLPTEELFSEQGPRRLVLVTCGGPFNRALSSYRDNVIVIATPQT